MLQPLLSITEKLWKCRCRQPGKIFFFSVSPKPFGSGVPAMFAKQNSKSYLGTVFILKLKTFAHILNFSYFPGVGEITGRRFLPVSSQPA